MAARGHPRTQPRNIGHGFTGEMREQKYRGDEDDLGKQAGYFLQQTVRSWAAVEASAAPAGLGCICQLVRFGGGDKGTCLYNPSSIPFYQRMAPGAKRRLQKGLYRVLQEPRLTPAQHNRSAPLTCWPCLPRPKTAPMRKHLGDVWGEMRFTSFFGKQLRFPL